MSKFRIKEWFNKGSSTKTVINKDALNDLEKRIAEASDSNSIEKTGKENGVDYIKYADGRLFCWGTVTLPAMTQEWHGDAVHVTFPVPFAYTSYGISVTMLALGNGYASRVNGYRNKATDGFDVISFNASKDTAIEKTSADWTASGYWK